MPDRGPGPIALFGSGETSASGRAVFDHVLSSLPQPIRVAVLETPAGFELNSDRVAGRVADFIRERLQNYHPEVTVVPARKRGSPFSPDDPEIVAPMLQANAIFLGPGSPTYAVRQLKESLAWQILQARHRLGAGIVLASAATIAASVRALPVYEIYKVGEDVYWSEGLDFFGSYGLRLVFVPHWNNREGGEELDTGRCFMGRSRFAELLTMLPPDVTVVGIDEHTALVLDPARGTCQALGRGSVHVLREGANRHFERQVAFPMTELGPLRVPEPQEGIPEAVWDRVLAAERQHEGEMIPSPEVLALVERRQEARARQDWATADALREQIQALGWQVNDTPEGPELTQASDVSSS